MMPSLAESIVKLKSEFVRTYKPKFPLYEIIPSSSSDLLSISDDDLTSLHRFAINNPIYTKTTHVKVSNIPCKVYEGDINQYWLNSIKHDTSYAPFYTTWILSAYAIAIAVKNVDCKEVIDIGSGDGRIAYCCSVIGLKSHSIEIDENLVELQRKLSASTKVNFNPKCTDATVFDYSSLNLFKPAFVIGGLPEVGEMLANNVIEKIKSNPKLGPKSCFILTGSHKKRKFSKDNSSWGWGELIERFDLHVTDTLTLPTQWTMDQDLDTPYIFSMLH